METLLKSCQSCNKPMNGGVYRSSHICPHCSFFHEGGKKSRMKKARSNAAAVDAKVAEQAKPSPKPSNTGVPAPEVGSVVEPVQAQDVVLTAKTVEEQGAAQVKDILQEECVLSLELTPDMFDNGKFIGSKSEKVQAALAQGKKHVLTQLREAAGKLGADKVAAVAVKNGIKAVDSKNAKVTVKATGTALLSEELVSA